MNTVYPKAQVYDLLLTAINAISHHDPATTNDSNRNLFNRQAQLVTQATGPVMIDQQVIDEITRANQLPAELADIFRDITFPEFMGVCLVKRFLDTYNSVDGLGLFTGMERYARLEDRLCQAATVSRTLSAFWDRLVRLLRMPIHGGEADRELLTLLRATPLSVQRLVLRSLTENYRSAVALGRLWHSEAKLNSPEYAATIGRAPITQLVHLYWPAESLTLAATGARVMEIPAVSGNSLRHQVVREPAWLHLCQWLDLEPAEPGRGPIPPGVEAIFSNGGNIVSGAKSPSTAFNLAARIRTLYPTLDLLGGVTNSFDLGESRLRVAGWLICAENREALRDSPAYDLPAATISVFDMLDDVTLTRHATMAGLGQMIYSFETLLAGAQVLCRLVLTPFTPRNTRGALVAAVETFMADDGQIGGQGRVGYGWTTGRWLRRPDGDADVRSEYEAYLTSHRELLTMGLRDGTLGTGSVVVS